MSQTGGLLEGDLLEAAGLLNFSRLRLGAIRRGLIRGWGLIRGNTVHKLAPVVTFEQRIEEKLGLEFSKFGSFKNSLRRDLHFASC